MSELLVLPFYVVADVSYSMTQAPQNAGPDGRTPLDALNTLVPALKDAIDENPILGDKVRFSLIDFSDDATTQIPLCDLSKIQTADIPALVARGGTSFVAAFTALRRQIDSDTRQLKADGNKVHRPAVFFLTDGEPTDQDSDWQRAFADLTDPSFKARPNMIPFGVGEAKKAVLDQIVHPVGRMRSFVAKDGVDAASAIRSMAELLIGSIIASANSVTDEGDSGGFVPPDVDEDPDWL
jgi:uncharacterized protein YegL